MATTLRRGEPRTRESPSDRIAGAGWGVFFLWIGIAILASIPSWITLLGIGAITLGVQAARKSMSLHVEGFWLVVGVLFLAAALWDLSGTAVELLPILLILIGGGFLVSLFSKRAG